MKKAGLLLSLVFALLFCACSHAAEPVTTAFPDPGGSQPESQQTAPTQLICRIVDGAGTDSLLLAGNDGEIYTLGKGEVPAVTLDGAESDWDSLRSGMAVTVVYSGETLETWPAQFGAVESLAAQGDADDRCGLYLQVLEDLWNTDEGLNGGELNYLGMDLSGLTHLTQAERSAVIWRFAENHGLTPVEGTWDELCDGGYIDRDNLYFRDGILFTVITDPAQTSPDSTVFDARKWRGGDGADFFYDCTAQRDAGGAWSYSVGGWAIS